MRPKEQIRQKVWSVMQRKSGTLSRRPRKNTQLYWRRSLRAPARRKIILEARQSFEIQSGLTAKSDSAQSSCRWQNRLYGGAAPAQSETIYRARSSETKLFPYTASSIQGAAKFGRLIGLDEIKKIDLIICGSVASIAAALESVKAAAIRTWNSPC